ncbi:pre-mRNA splicing factor [Gorgonomyces haynaldii]|nr:pre-mRNA splicing factor [Gorgonomyces haynaldii]
MDFLKQVIEQKQQELDKVAKQSGQKYLKRSDLERLREEAYTKEQSQVEQERQLKKQKLEKELQETKNEQYRLISAERKQLDQQVLETVSKLSEEDLIKRFRAIGEPIKLFGETREERILRLHHTENARDIAHEQTNELRTILKETDKELTEDLMRDQKSEKTEKQVNAADTTQISTNLLKSNPVLTRTLLVIYYTNLLQEWQQSLESRPDDEKRTSQGKLAQATCVQTGEYLKPLFKKLKKNKIPEDVLELLTEITFWTIQREYMQANDAYIRLSIGNAPWPIGVTAVSGHERANDEKIKNTNIAHILNDETQRKWIQSIKRLITFAQQKYPPSDVSKLIG